MKLVNIYSTKKQPVNYFIETTFFGQMGGIYFFDQALNELQVQVILFEKKSC